MEKGEWVAAHQIKRLVADAHARRELEAETLYFQHPPAARPRENNSWLALR